MDTRLRKVERLRKREEIRSVLRRRGVDGRFCSIHTRLNCGSYSRLAVVVSRAVGKAVVRNKAKRRLREVFRRTKGRFNQSVDLVIRAKRMIREADYSELAKEIQELLQRCKLL